MTGFNIEKKKLFKTLITTMTLLLMMLVSSFTVSADTNSNPHDLVFVDSNKAYVLRYGSDYAWIVNPSTTSEAGFKTGELDLSAYADGDGHPEMHVGVIVNNKLFIVLQRYNLDTYTPTDPPYIAVFDTTTDTEIDTTVVSGVTNPDSVVGIQLPVLNPVSIQYLPGNDTIYVAGIGDYGFSDSGGIATIDPDTYDVDTLLEGGAPYGAIAGISIVSPSKGYFIGYAGWQDNTLYSFDPSGVSPVGSAVTGFTNMSIGGMENTISLDDNDRLWICNQTGGQVDILDITTDTIDESVDTILNPLKVVFAEDLGGDSFAAIATAAADWSSGAHSVVTVDPVGGPRTSQNQILPTGSDISVVSYEQYFYRLERSNAHNITKFDISAPDTPIWQYSTDDEDDEEQNTGGSSGCFISSAMGNFKRWFK